MRIGFSREAARKPRASHETVRDINIPAPTFAMRRRSDLFKQHRNSIVAVFTRRPQPSQDWAAGSADGFTQCERPRPEAAKISARKHLCFHLHQQVSAIHRTVSAARIRALGDCRRSRIRAWRLRDDEHRLYKALAFGASKAGAVFSRNTGYFDMPRGACGGGVTGPRATRHRAHGVLSYLISATVPVAVPRFGYKGKRSRHIHSFDLVEASPIYSRAAQSPRSTTCGQTPQQLLELTRSNNARNRGRKLVGLTKTNESGTKYGDQRRAQSRSISGLEISYGQTNSGRNPRAVWRPRAVVTLQLRSDCSHRHLGWAQPIIDRVCRQA